MSNHCQTVAKLKGGRETLNVKTGPPLSPYFSFSIVLLSKKMLSLRFSQSHLYMAVCNKNSKHLLEKLVSGTL